MAFRIFKNRVSHVLLLCYRKKHFHRLHKMIASAKMTGKTPFYIKCFTCLLASILAIHVATSELLVYHEMQCEDLCLRESSCQTYNIGPIQASGKKACHLNPQNGKQLDLRVSIIGK